jgi:hypothetical protein
LEDKFDVAVKMAQTYVANAEDFEHRRNEFKRSVNEREKTEGLWGKKYGFVTIERVNKDNFYNLLSEFHLRPQICDDTSLVIASDLITTLLSF